MKADVSIEGGRATITVSGRVDAVTSKDLQEVVNELGAETTSVVFDFKDVDYISSAGLRVIMSAGKKLGATQVSIINVVPDVFEIFHMAGYDGVFAIEAADESVSTYINRSFKDILADKAKKCADVPAVTHLGITYTWKELDQAAQICANDLFKLGVRKGAHVGICSGNSANWIICFFAAQKLGAVACLLNFNYNEEEIINVSAVGDITVLCLGEAPACKDRQAFLASVTSAEGSTIEQTYDISSELVFKNRLDEYDAVEGLFDAKVETDDVCIMIYTSGSTGVPKGVLLSAYNILNAAEVWAEEIRIDDKDKICLILPLFHIFGLIAGMFCNALCNSLIVIPDSLRTDAILSAIYEYRCTLFHSVPTMVLALMNNKQFSADKVSSLRCSVLGGAPATEAQTKRMWDTFTENHFVTAYGLSEMTPVSVTHYGDTFDHVAHTVGQPVRNVKVKIVDIETDAEQPTGKTGEVVVEGFNLMTCYYKADMDMQSVDDSGWLHTGDLGFMDEDGYLHLTGRAKELIIRGGENIMPNEIAEAITKFPDVADVKVQGVPDDFFGEVVGVSLVMKEKKQLDKEALMAFLAQHLAKYKLPAFIFQFDEFPLLSNGKIDAVSLKKIMNERALALRDSAKK